MGGVRGGAGGAGGGAGGVGGGSGDGGGGGIGGSGELQSPNVFGSVVTSEPSKDEKRKQ